MPIFGVLAYRDYLSFSCPPIHKQIVASWPHALEGPRRGREALTIRRPVSKTQVQGVVRFQSSSFQKGFQQPPSPVCLPSFPRLFFDFSRYLKDPKQRKRTGGPPFSVFLNIFFSRRCSSKMHFSCVFSIFSKTMFFRNSLPKNQSINYRPEVLPKMSFGMIFSRLIFKRSFL